MRRLQDLDINSSTRVILRCDLNLPQNDSGEFTDFFRLESSLPTIEYLKDRGATIFITSHLGSPKGKIIDKLSLAPLAKIISDQLNKQVEFIPDPFNQTNDLSHLSGIFLIENLRFWPGEESNLIDFAKDLVKKTASNLFIQDGFGAIHRDHASITKVPQLIPSGAGLLLQKEVDLLNSPDQNDLVLIIGGAKVESKLPVIANFLDKADKVLTGGVVANTFLKALNKDISNSIYEAGSLELAKKILEDSKQSKTQIIIPTDYVCAKNPDQLLVEEFDQNNIKSVSDQMILDLGPSSTQEYIKNLSKAKTVIWAGTVGYAEKAPFSKASKNILNSLLENKLKHNNDLKIIIGGGDTVDFIRDNLDQEELQKIDHISTGGGASLLLLSGQELPGIKALQSTPVTILEQQSSLDKTEQASVLSEDRPILVANLKSHFNLAESKEWFNKVLSSDTLVSPKVNFIIAPSDIFLEELSSDLKSKNLKNVPEIYAQNISDEDEGSNTGEIAATQLKSIASGAIIGHSERRIKHDEDNEIIFKKIVKATDNNLRVILCIGGKSKDANLHQQEIYDQLLSAYLNLNSAQTNLITIAYEPVFAIGTGQVPEDNYLKDQLKLIRDFLEDHGATKNKILYGGSVNKDNTKQILSLGFDGLLVGSASLNPLSIEDIGKNISA